MTTLQTWATAIFAIRQMMTKGYPAARAPPGRFTRAWSRHPRSCPETLSLVASSTIAQLRFRKITYVTASTEGILSADEFFQHGQSL
jgi:hypothetical protein